MSGLVTMDEANFHLRRDTADDDAYVDLLIKAASAVVRNYLKAPTAAYETVEDSNGDPVIVEDSNGPVVLPEAKAATLIILGELYRNREGASNFKAYMIPDSVAAILYPLRTPTLA